MKNSVSILLSALVMVCATSAFAAKKKSQLQLDQHGVPQCYTGNPKTAFKEMMALPLNPPYDSDSYIDDEGDYIEQTGVMLLGSREGHMDFVQTCD